MLRTTRSSHNGRVCKAPFWNLQRRCVTRTTVARRRVCAVHAIAEFFREYAVTAIQDLNDMFLFAKVIEHGGYSAASRALGIATSKLSRRVSELERQLGVHLVNRSTRSISLSDAGENFYRHCLAVVGEAAAACEAMDKVRAAPSGLVRLACPVGLIFTDVGEIISRYMADNPAVRVRLEATNRPVDVVEEGFDLALRASVPPLEDSQLVVRPLAALEVVTVCSPWFIAQHRRPETVQDLEDLPTLTIGTPDNRYAWPLVDEEGRGLDVHHTPRLVTNDLYTLRTAALQGIGIAPLPLSLVRKDLAEGRLVQVLPELRPVDRIVHAVFPSRRGLIPAVRSLIDALVVGFERSSGKE